MKCYIIRAEDADDLIYEMITCMNCKYFGHTDYEKTYPKHHICRHPDAMAHPTPDSWCSCAEEKEL